MSEAKAKKKKLSIPVKLAIALVLGVVAGLIFKEKASYVAPGAVQHHRRYRQRG